MTSTAAPESIYNVTSSNRMLPDVPSPNVLLSPESAEVFREAVSVMQHEYGKPAGTTAASNFQQQQLQQQQQQQQQQLKAKKTVREPIQ